MPISDPALLRLRQVYRVLPEVHETTTFGNPTWQAGKKTFAVLDRYQHRPCIAFKAKPSVQRLLCETSAYAKSPFGAKHGWTLVWVESRMDWRKLEGLLIDSYRLVALKRMLNTLDGLRAG